METIMCSDMNGAGDPPVLARRVQAVPPLRRREADEAATGTTRRLRVIAWTALTATADRQRCLDTDMNDFLGEPVRVADLERVLDRWARRRGGAPLG
jgi:CheY-like chemotaxis protein